MNNEELPKLANPAVIEHIELLFAKPMILVDTVFNLIEAQHYEASAQVCRKLSEEMVNFKKDLAFIKDKAIEYNQNTKAECEVLSQQLKAITPEQTTEPLVETPPAQ